MKLELRRLATRVATIRGVLLVVACASDDGATVTIGRGDGEAGGSGRSAMRDSSIRGSGTDERATLVGGSTGGSSLDAGESRGAGNGGEAGGAGGGAGSTGVDASTPSSAKCPPSALVCEDFEDGKADGWSPLVDGMTIDTLHASSGKYALSLNIPANGRGGFITRKGAPLFPLVNKTMWGRVMVWFDSISDGHTDIIRGQSASAGNPQYNVGEQHGAYMLNYYNGSSATDCWARPKAPTPTGVPLHKWMCWEWSFDSGTNSMQFFVDGTLYRAVKTTGDGCLSGNGAWVAPQDFGSVGVGASIAETRPTVMQLWIDDVAIGTEQRIGCP